eukprot:gene2496-4852_t
MFNSTLPEKPPISINETAPSHKGNFDDFQQRQYTQLSPSPSVTVVTTYDGLETIFTFGESNCTIVLILFCPSGKFSLFISADFNILGTSSPFIRGGSPVPVFISSTIPGRRSKVMSIFEAYDQEFNALSHEISNNISDLRTYTTNPEKSTYLIGQIERLLSQAGELMKQMEVEVRSQDQATRKVLSDKVTQYKKSLASLKADFEKSRDEAQKSSLMVGSKSGEQRQRLMNANDKLLSQNEKIMNATRTVAETENVAIEITQELHRNREKIESAHGKVREFAGITDTARRLLHSMNRREIQQKFTLGFVALILIAAIIIVIYFTVVKKGES